MMKSILLAGLVLLCLTGCFTTKQSSSTTDSQTIESTILWNAKLDSGTWEPIELKQMLSNPLRFTKEGNFYKVKDGTIAFGHEVLYIGTLGLDMIPGPNVMLKGNPSEIAEQITQQYGVKFEKNGDEYNAELKKDIRLFVAPHPSREGTTLVIGAYLGK